MPGRPSDSRSLTYVGVAVAVVAFVGTVAFDWSFSGDDGILPFVLGGVAVAIAVSWELYRRRA